MTLVGAVPAGGALYALIQNLLDRADSLGTVLLAVTITAAVCTTLIVLTPFIVLVFYKDTRDPAELKAKGDAAAATPEKAAAAATAAEGFGDAIPEDFDENELAASVDDGEFESMDDDVESFDDDDFGDYDEEYEEFDEDEEL